MVGGDSLPVRKPHPGHILGTLERLGVAPGDAVMVGDSLTQDIEGARRIGMRGVLVRRSDAGGHAPDPGVPVIRSLRELPSLL
ncbi:Phosphoglycolate phosphatase [compost metagenome]